MPRPSRAYLATSAPSKKPVADPGLERMLERGRMQDEFFDALEERAYQMSPEGYKPGTPGLPKRFRVQIAAMLRCRARGQRRLPMLRNSRDAFEQGDLILQQLLSQGRDAQEAVTILATALAQAHAENNIQRAEAHGSKRRDGRVEAKKAASNA